MRFTRFYNSLLCSVFALLIPPVTTPGATVNVCDDASLRAAVAAGGTITFGCDGTIALGSAIEVTNTVVLDAAGRDVTISGGGTTRVFLVQTNGSLTMIGMKLINGLHSVEGAGILNLGSLAVQKCFLSNNVSLAFGSGGSGGAIANRGALDVSDTTFAANLVFLEGGAILNAGAMLVNRCAFIGNTASFGGGAISVRTSPQLPPTGITNCTFYQNTGRASDIYNSEIGFPGAGFVNAVNCTFSTDPGVSIGSLAGTTPRVWVANSILRGFTNQFVDGGNNLLQSTPDNLYLGPLANNGGPTPTRELLPDSPAIDQGNNAVCPPVDQRGVSRPVRAKCDIGALETSNEPTPASIQFASASYVASEAATNAVVRVVRSGNSGGTASVSFQATGGLATAGHDFIATNGILTLAAGQESLDVLIPLINDTSPEMDETVSLSLASPSSNVTLGTPSSAVLTIEDDDPKNAGILQFQLADYSIAEGTGRALVMVERTGGTNGIVSVDISTSDGTALAGQDYVATNTTITFGDTEARKTFLVDLLDDPANDGLESFNLNLANPTGGASVGSKSVATVTVIDRLQILSACDENSLRTATTAGGRVRFDCDATIMLTSALDISKGLELDANGHAVTISGSNSVRHFYVHSGATLALRGLQFVDGRATGTNGSSGQSGGMGEGGSIYNSDGIVFTDGCSFIRNVARGGNGGPAPQFGLGESGGPGQGGGLYNSSKGGLRIYNTVFLSNSAIGGTGGTASASAPVTGGGVASGGAIFNEGGDVFISGGLIQSNQAFGGQGKRFSSPFGNGNSYGGAIFTKEGHVELNQVSVVRNQSAGEILNFSYGGAIHVESGQLRLTECNLAFNRAVAGSGAAVGTPQGVRGAPAFGGALSLLSGSAEIGNSTIASNIALGGKTASTAGSGAAYGGAIFNAGRLAMVNATIVGNEAFAKDAPDAFYGGNSYGGAICNDGGIVTLNWITVSSNSARAHRDQKGGGVFSGSGMIELANSIVAHSPSGSNCFGTIIDGGNNLSSDGSANFTAPGSLNNTDPVLGPLADYGGPTPTMALLNGSPAIDAAGSGSCPSTDQRGVARPFGAACDIGAFESSPPYTVLGRITGFTTPASGVTVSAGSSTASVPPDGNYALHGLSPGNQLVTPASMEAVFVLSNRLVNVARDTIGVDFHSYRSNALVIERIGTGATRSVFAGEAGQTYHVEVSTEFQGWTPYSTNTTASSGLFEFNDTNGVLLSPRLFRVLRP